MIPVGRLLICYSVIMSALVNVGASRESQTSNVFSCPPDERDAASTRDVMSPQKEMARPPSAVIWRPMRVFSLVPQTLCCTPLQLQASGECTAVPESREAESSDFPKCKEGHLKEGDRVPHCVWKQHIKAGIDKSKESSWEDLDSHNIFSQKRVVVFGVPGAFTPVCSSWQVPAFDAAYMDFKKEGIDAVYCITVNDTFVTAAWAKDLNIKNISIIPDGNACFTAGMGMLVRKSNKGFGCRSWRYAAVISDGIIEKIFVESCIHNDATVDPHFVSTPENVLAYLRSPDTEIQGDKSKVRQATTVKPSESGSQ